MSPESIESRLAELRTEVRQHERHLQMLGPLVGQFQVLDDRISRAFRDIDGIRNDLNTRMHGLHDEFEGEVRREAEALHQRITRIAERRDRQFEAVDKRIADVSLTLKADIDDCRNEAVAVMGDRTSRRGQNIGLIATIVTGLLVIIQGIVNQI